MIWSHPLPPLYQGKATVPKGRIASVFPEGVLFITYSLLVTRSGLSAKNSVSGRFGSFRFLLDIDPDVTETPSPVIPQSAVAAADALDDYVPVGDADQSVFTKKRSEWVVTVTDVAPCREAVDLLVRGSGSDRFSIAFK